jgi:YVTN family beta-propeller protein
MLRRLGIAVMALVISCSSQVRTTDTPPAQAPKMRAVDQEHSQIVIYARSDASSNAPVVWEIRKISLDRADGTQVDIPGSSTSLSLSEIERTQKTLHIAPVQAGDYTGATIFTRGILYEGTSNAFPIDSKIHKIQHDISVVPGDAKTIVILVEVPDSDPSRTDGRIAPVLAIEDENPRPKGKLVYVANERSASISVIDKGLGRVVYNVLVGSSPYALAADHRRNRLYIGDRKDGVIYEMDMLSNHLLKANQLAFVDEPVHIEPIPPKDIFIVVNYGTNTIYLIDSFSLQTIQTVEVGEDPINAVYSVYRDLVFVLNEAFGTVSVIDLDTQPVEVDTILDVELEPAGMAIYEADDYLFVSNTGSTDLSVIDLKQMGLEKAITIGIGGGDIAFDPFSRRLYVGMVETKEVLCVDPFTDVVVFTIGLPGRPGKLLFDDDEKRLYVALPDNDAVVVIDPMRREIQHWIETGRRPVSMALRL